MDTTGKGRVHRGGAAWAIAGALALAACVQPPCVLAGRGAAGPGAGPGPGPSQKVLLDFEKGFAFDQVPAEDARVTEARTADGSALQLATGHRRDWPGITLKAPGGRWDLSAYGQLAMDVRNVGTNAVTVCWRVDNPGGDGQRNCLTESLTLPPGGKGTLLVELSRSRMPFTQDAKPIKLFGMRGYPWDMSGGRGIDPRNVIQFIIFVPRPMADHVFQIDNLRAAGKPPAPTSMPAKFFPFIDELGQYIHKDWPGKTHSLAELPERRDAEAKDLSAHPGPEGWDDYGGWDTGPQLRAGGFFRAEKYQGKWWLVDPKGRLFFSHGTDCVDTSADTPIDDRDAWFRLLPPGDDPLLGALYGRQGHVVNGYYVGKQPRTFDFGTANVIRKYGKDYRTLHAQVAHRRLRSWGMNTIANWSDARIYGLRKTPYVATIHFGGKPLAGSRGYWGQFRDVFDPSFAGDLRRRLAQEAHTSAGDPWCIGYFVDNELSWGSEISLAEAALASPPEQPAKKAFVEDLKSRYDSIDKLNAAWGTRHASWEALLAGRRPPGAKAGANASAKGARADLLAFSARTAETYFKAIRDAVKAVAPNQLYLGCRFAWANPVAVAAAVRYCDVVSYNLYHDSVADFRMPVSADVPLIIGEFHFGALDRGMFHTGLRARSSQADRAAAYRDYVRGALRHRQLVGTHWFKYRDESTTGRALDGENYQIGLLDVCDTPYAETVAAVREVGYGMYQYRLRAK